MVTPLLLLAVGLLGTAMFIAGCFGYKKHENVSYKEASLQQNFSKTRSVYLIAYGGMFMLLGYMSLYSWLVSNG